MKNTYLEIGLFTEKMKFIDYIYVCYRKACEMQKSMVYIRPMDILWFSREIKSILVRHKSI